MMMMMTMMMLLLVWQAVGLITVRCGGGLELGGKDDVVGFSVPEADGEGGRGNKSKRDVEERSQVHDDSAELAIQKPLAVEERTPQDALHLALDAEEILERSLLAGGRGVGVQEREEGRKTGLKHGIHVRGGRRRGCKNRHQLLRKHLVQDVSTRHLPSWGSCRHRGGGWGGVGGWRDGWRDG